MKGNGRLMNMQKATVIRIVDAQHQQGRKVGEVVATLGSNRAT